eukprot:gene14470-19150_t
MNLLESLPTVIGIAAVAPALLVLWLVIATDERPGPPGLVWASFLLGAASISLLGFARGLFAAIPGLSGFVSAAPILFEAFSKSRVAQTPLHEAPAGALRLAEAELPVSLKRFSRTSDGLVTITAREPAPQIVYPPEDAQVELALATPDAMPLSLKLQGGRPPFRWLANGKALDNTTRNRIYQWQPDSAGYSTLTVIDAVGRAASPGFCARFGVARAGVCRSPGLRRLIPSRSTKPVAANSTASLSRSGDRIGLF